jgi:hypothetical protein
MFTTEGLAFLTSLENEPGIANGSLAVAGETKSRNRSVKAKPPAAMDSKGIMAKQKGFFLTQFCRNILFSSSIGES